MLWSPPLRNSSSRPSALLASAGLWVRATPGLPYAFQPEYALDGAVWRTFHREPFESIAKTSIRPSPLQAAVTGRKAPRRSELPGPASPASHHSSSRRSVPTNRSANEFAHGDRTGVY
jgi:hypothetical protein